MAKCRGDWFTILGNSFFLYLIINIGYAAVLPPPASNSSSGEGAVRTAYVKTNFSCEGRPSGYYADVDTGCELYHMCDALGRKFSYACPNTTLFQQRMLVCDHWFMVNCSKAEDDYSANLLIGQRDKPFVAVGETVHRTPRPDLKDRPYSADYSGDSFRKHFKHHIKNMSPGGTQQTPEYAPIHWAITSQNQGDQYSQVFPESAAQVATQATSESQNSINGQRRVFQVPTGFTKPEIVKSLDVTDNVQIPSAVFEIPNQQTEQSQVSSTQRVAVVPETTPTVQRKIHVVPSAFAKAFEPNPHLFKNKEHNDVARQFTTKDVRAEEALTTAKAIEAPTRAAVTEQPPPPTTTFNLPSTTTTTTTERPPPPPPSVPLQITVADQGRPSSQLVIPEPIDGLQPPHLHYKTYDDATTEGPPIYYQWKWAVPAFILEPPKLNEPKTGSADDEKSPTARSIDGTGNPGLQDESLKFNQNFFRKAIQPPEHNFLELKKNLSIPSFDFPLETQGRNGFTNSEAFNSYQLKIPFDQQHDQSWYGENKECPECHPAFLQPGTCEPCVKR